MTPQVWMDLTQAIFSGLISWIQTTMQCHRLSHWHYWHSGLWWWGGGVKRGTCGRNKKVQKLLKLVLLLNSHCELQSYGRVSCPPRKKGVFSNSVNWYTLKCHRIWDLYPIKSSWCYVMGRWGRWEGNCWASGCHRHSDCTASSLEIFKAVEKEPWTTWLLFQNYPCSEQESHLTFLNATTTSGFPFVGGESFPEPCSVTGKNSASCCMWTEAEFLSTSVSKQIQKKTGNC